MYLLLFYFIWKYFSCALFLSLSVLSLLSYFSLFVFGQLVLMCPLFPHSWQMTLFFINIFSIVVLLCELLIKCNSVRWWVSSPWIIVLVLIKKLVCIDHVFMVVSIPLGVIIFQFFKKPAIFLPVTLKNNAHSSYCYLDAWCTISFLSGSRIAYLPPGYFPSFYISTMSLSLSCPLNADAVSTRLLNVFVYYALYIYSWWRE